MNVRKQIRCAGEAKASLIFLVLLAFASLAQGVILFRTGDPAANTTEPTGSLAGSGWQFEGNFGNFLGTAIAPHYFVTAKHLGTIPTQFVYHGVNYAIVRSFADSDSDLDSGRPWRLHSGLDLVILDLRVVLPPAPYRLVGLVAQRLDEAGKRLGGVPLDIGAARDIRLRQFQFQIDA